MIALTDAFDKLDLHLKHNCYDGGCTLYESRDGFYSEAEAEPLEWSSYE